MAIKYNLSRFNRPFLFSFPLFFSLQLMMYMHNIYKRLGRVITLAKFLLHDFSYSYSIQGIINTYRIRHNLMLYKWIYPSNRIIMSYVGCVVCICCLSSCTFRFLLYEGGNKIIWITQSTNMLLLNRFGCSFYFRRFFFHLCLQYSCTYWSSASFAFFPPA